MKRLELLSAATILLSIIMTFYEAQAQNIWQQIYPTGELPEARQGHTMVSIGDKIYLYGGMSYDKSIFNHISVYDVEQQWVKEKPVYAPPVRHHHKAIAYENKMYIFFGCGETQKYNDTWYYNTVTKEWTEINVPEPRPAARSQCSGVLIGNMIWFFGGLDQDENILNDLWAYNLSDGAWEQYPPSALTSLYGHISGQNDDNIIYLFGGFNNTGLNSEMIAYNIGNNSWSIVVPEGEIPTPTANMCVVPYLNNIAYLFCGTDDEGPVGNCYKWDLTNNNFYQYAAGPTLNNAAASFINPYNGDKSTTFQKFIVFGGNDGDEILGNTWEYVSDIEITTDINSATFNANICHTPNTDNIVLEIYDLNTQYSYQIIDITGKILLSDRISNFQTEIYTRDLNQGMYFVNIFNNNSKILTLKFLKP